MLKKYKESQVVNSTTKYEKSGVESPKTKGEELLILVPYRTNERGEYRCIDKTANWKGWVIYNPDPVEVPAQPANTPRKNYVDAVQEFKNKKQLVDLGVFTAEELDLEALKQSIRSKYQSGYTEA